jgi:predicted ATP-dependent serine protease
MKKVLLLVATIATLGLVSCNNAQVNAEKATQDSLAEVAKLDSIAKAQADSIQIAIEAAEAAAADTLSQVVEETAELTN